MKKAFFVIALVAMVLAGCTSVTDSGLWYRQDGLVPLEHFQTARNADERLVFISPVLAPDHQRSQLYIITNPEDILKALDTLGDRDVVPLKDLEKALKAFSPVVIASSRYLPTANNVLLTASYSISGTFVPNISNQDGIAVFSLPLVVDQFFYAYVISSGIVMKGDARFGIISLPPGSQDVYMAFSEEKGEIVVSANINPDVVKKAYDTTNGMYGRDKLLGEKDQVGFIGIGFKERVAISNEQRRAEALAAGATYSVYSKYYTFRQETRTSTRYVPEQSHWEPGQTVGFYDSRGAYIGEARTAGRQVTDVAAHRENVDYPVNVRVLHELEFELYKGDVRVFRGTTPVKITGIEVGTEYTLRWVSPVGGNRSSRFIMGLDFLGYPGDGRYYID